MNEVSRSPVMIDGPVDEIDAAFERCIAAADEVGFIDPELPERVGHPGTVASPTPTVGTLGDSIKVTRTGGPSLRSLRTVTSMHAVIQPAVPPPTMVM